MALDHYVSQVHLKNFYSPELKDMLHAIRKSDLKKFTARSQDICRIEEGSTNAYLKEDRAIEEFLKDVEPRYNASLDKLRENRIDRECILSIAGFASYLVSCSPAAMRIQTGPLKAALQSTAEILDTQGIFGKSPKALGERSLTDLLSDGTVKFDVDPKYPQAIGISNITRNVSIFGNSRWEVLINPEAENPFLTSDFPIGIETFEWNTPINRVVPLAPDLAIRIIPDITLARAPEDLSFAKFRQKRRRLKRSEVHGINRLITKCAEDLVLYRDHHSWTERFVERNARYRIEPFTQQIPNGRGKAIFATQRVLART